MMKARVIVTGARGFIGPHVTAALISRGATVHATSRSNWSATGSVIAHRCDLSAPDQWRHLVNDVRPTHLLHLAWFVEHGRFWAANENVEWATTTTRVVQDFLAAGGSRVVGVGTCAEYAAS